MNIKHEPFYSEDFPVKVEVEANPEFVVFSTPVRVQTARSGLKVEPEVDLNELSILEESYSKYLEKQRKEQPGNHDDWSVTPSGSKQSRQPTRPEDYNCVFCEKTFTMIKLKKQHMKADHESELFCRICYRKCKTVFSAEKCIKEHQFGYNNLCQVCGKHFRKKASLELHLAAVHSTKCKMFSCDLCGLQTKHKKSIWRHIRTMHMSKELVGYPCPHLDTCPDLFYMTNNSLRLHLYRHHNVPAPVSCPECNAGFNNISELKNHQKSACVHSSGSGIRRRENLDYSVLCAIIEGRYHCKLCPKSFNLKPQFSHHYQEFHKDNKTCDICNKTFGSAHDYRRHKKVVHDKIKKYRCEHPGCGKTFGYSTGLRNHINTHTGKLLKLIVQVIRWFKVFFFLIFRWKTFRLQLL